IEACRRALAGGATMIQVRLKDAAPRDVLTLARALVGALSVPVIVNDRVDVALAANAAGAHLGQEGPPLDRLRPHVPPGFLLGLSVGPPAGHARGPPHRPAPRPDPTRPRHPRAGRAPRRISTRRPGTPPPQTAAARAAERPR